MVRPFKVCICADDYAMTSGISRGIIEGLDAGVLTATSVMTTSRSWPEAAAELIPFKTRASIGLHLNLTLGAPLGAMPQLAPDNQFPTIRRFLGMSRQDTMPRDEIAEEIDRQLEAFSHVFGGPPDHVDGHQHVHVLQPVRQLLFEALQRRGWRAWIRDSGDQILRILRRGGPLRKALAVKVLARGMKSDAKDADLITNIGFSGFSSFDISEDYRQQLMSFLSAPGPRHLVMCHPGYVDDELRGLDPVVETREQELRILTSPAFRALLDDKNASLANMRAML